MVFQRALIFLILITSLTGCTNVYRMRGKIVQKIEAEALVDVILTYATELKYEKNIHLQDSKIYYKDDVQGVRLDFITQDIIELCPARELLVDVTEGLLERLNKSAVASAQTEKGHFTVKDLEIYIQYESFFIKYVDPLYIGWITLRDEMSTFYAGDINTYRLDFWHSRMEPYYKTLQFVTITRNAEQNYKATHPDKSKDSLFGEDKFGPVDWFSGSKKSQ